MDDQSKHSNQYLEETHDTPVAPASLKAFFAENMNQDGMEREVVISRRFTDKKGKPIPWIIRALTDIERDDIQRQCMRTVLVRKNGRYRNTQELDVVAFSNRLRAKAVVHPNLDDAALQNSYGVQCAEDLLGVMLTANEGILLLEEVNAMGAPNEEEQMAELSEEAKN